VKKYFQNAKYSVLYSHIEKMEELNMIGDRIRNLREDKRMSQLELAKALNISNTTLSQYENNQRTPSDEIKIKIANYFNVSIDYLLGQTNIKNPDNNPKLPEMFISPQDAMKFLLEQNIIMGYGGFDINKLSDEEVIEFANELLNQLRILSYKYKR
jgi:transcriptional regulator with XRE-family HTH domain